MKKRVKREVVRCKDCKFGDGNCRNGYYCHNRDGFVVMGNAFFVRPDDYCSRGKVRR